MMLDQIRRRLAAKEKEVAMQTKDVAEMKNRGLVSPDRVPGSKVVAIDVDPEMYEQLQAIAKKHGVRGVRGALGLAAKTGIRHL